MRAYVFFSLLGVLILTSCRNNIQKQFIEKEREEISFVDSTKVTKVYSFSDAVRCGFLDHHGQLWFGTTNEGLYKFDGKQFIHYSIEEGLCSNQISAITEDAEGKLWLGTKEGLCYFDGKSFHSVEIPWDGNEDLWGEGMNANNVLSLLYDSQGNLWLGTWGNAVHRFDPSSSKNGKYEFSSFLQKQGRTYDGKYRNVIQTIFEDSAANIWFTSMSHGGISRYDGEKFEYLSLGEGLIDDMVFSGMQAQDGNYWFGMLGNRKGGLDKYDGKNFKHYNESHGLASNNITSIFENRDGLLWLASHRAKLSIFNPQKESIRIFRDQKGNSYEHILFLLEDASGNIWFGGNHGKLYRYDGNDLTDFTQKIAVN